MRTRTLVVVASAAALALFAYQHKAELPDPTALLVNARNQVQPFHYTLATEPPDPSCDAPTTLVVHALDTKGEPVEDLKMEARATILGTNHGVQEVKLRPRGHGYYAGSVSLELAGSWDVDLLGEKEGMRARQKLSVEIGPPRAAHPADDDDDDD